MGVYQRPGLEGSLVAVAINPKYCKSCGICVAFCPKKVLALDSEGKAYAANPGDCAGCRQCELRCPDFAIDVSKK
jgi:2-oxoglutarate ferredoxin oxidoreductase subunit delta